MPDDLGHIARLGNHGGPHKKGEQGDDVSLRQRGNSRAYILSRLRRDAENGGGRDVKALLAGVLNGQISAYAAAIEMGYSHRKPPIGRVEYPNVTKKNDWAMHRVLHPRSDPKTSIG
jgi:hypothetical protein